MANCSSCKSAYMHGGDTWDTQHMYRPSNFNPFLVHGNIPYGPRSVGGGVPSGYRFPRAHNGAGRTHKDCERTKLEYCKGQSTCTTNADCPSVRETCSKLGQLDCNGTMKCVWKDGKCDARGNFSPNVCKGGNCYPQGFPVCVKNNSDGKFYPECN